MNLIQERSIVEAALFLESDPVTIEHLIKVTGLSRDVLKEVMDELKDHYAGEEHGIVINEVQGGYVLAAKEALWDNLKEYYGKKNEDKLSRAAMETLSIIAYSQPLTKAEIENIRGVSSDGMIRLLVKRGLIREVGKKDVPGKPLQYGTSKEFLKLFRLKSISDLPKLDEVEQKRFELNG
ncbi:MULTISPECIES: SMC-Scp complex subunit ScpB [unclassified Oceanispirochaeta]|uniref:SMC-Scp complex subunit ScpB n=1 Tax=unclassified Oceanispirochaeta TaxID=2635722 RepID=UPI000E092093|nr:MULTISPECIES: SMC-Scp complex subunit ScpB [unclassified Oceanispirochaeta]MBF9016076.1 SMC-Scp complex subunit ScpB [Oceanispirochaeta sp. M2]NPD72539.1 SMC-Scp complex subunit ScpB [Oceanispirochaeta sp. M1]RDG31996.1 SMC-Scp complex subunit ScpB [Oceanispirochaeta sp. M1]